MSKITHAEAEVMARRYLRSFDGEAEIGNEQFEIALGAIMDAVDIIQRCGGHIAFMPPLCPAGGVYGEELRRNWLTGWVQ